MRPESHAVPSRNDVIVEVEHDLPAGRLVELRAEGFVCAVDLAREVLGFTAEMPFDEGIARTAAWYRDHGWL